MLSFITPLHHKRDQILALVIKKKKKSAFSFHRWRYFVRHALVTILHFIKILARTIGKTCAIPVLKKKFFQRKFHTGLYILTKIKILENSINSSVS